MALFPFCKKPTGLVRVTRIQLVLYCVLLSLIIYFLHGHKAVSVKKSHPVFHALGRDREQESKDVSLGKERPHEMGQEMEMKDMSVVKPEIQKTPVKTPWGAPLVWGDARYSAKRRSKFAQRGIRTGLLAFVVGTYARYVQRFLSSAEIHFLPGQMVTYYILTDNPRTMDPPIKLGPDRELKVVPVAEVPGWQRLAYRRMTLIADAIKDPIGSDVEYLFCADIDQEFVAPVGEEIFGDLVATLHPELYGMPRNAFPYEVEEDSSACVEEDEGDYYYTSELYGGLVSEVYTFAKGCSMLILKDQSNNVQARGLEESYLNRYLIDHRPTLVLSPEYSWWDSALAADVPVQRLVSLGRQTED